MRILPENVQALTLAKVEIRGQLRLGNRQIEGIGFDHCGLLNGKIEASRNIVQLGIVHKEMTLARFESLKLACTALVSISFNHGQESPLVHRRHCGCYYRSNRYHGCWCQRRLWDNMRMEKNLSRLSRLARHEKVPMMAIVVVMLQRKGRPALAPSSVLLQPFVTSSPSASVSSSPSSAPSVSLSPSLSQRPSISESSSQSKRPSLKPSASDKCLKEDIHYVWNHLLVSQSTRSSIVRSFQVFLETSWTQRAPTLEL